MKQKILLLLSPQEQAFTPELCFTLPPMALGVLSRRLKESGYATELADLNFSIRQNSALYDRERYRFLYDKQKTLDYINGAPDPEIDQLMETFLGPLEPQNCHAAGISVGADFSFFQIHFGFIIGMYLKQKYNLTVVFGGNNINFLYMFQDQFSELWRCVLENFDLVIRGPGESVILRALEIARDENADKRKKSFQELPGAVYLENDTVKANPENKPLVTSPDFDTLEMTFYEHRLLNDTSNGENPENFVYLYKWPHYLVQYVNSIRLRLPQDNFGSRLIIPYIFNYNCPYRCTFCSESDDSRKKVIIGDVDQTIRDLVELKERHNTPFFYFLNNAINNSVRFSDEFCGKIIEQNIEIFWSDCGRFNKMTYERLAAMHKAGCRKLTFGFETASHEILQYIDKRLDLEQAERVLQWCFEIGIWADLEVIVGLPYETDENFQETVDFLQRNKKYINYLSINEYFVVPHSLLGAYPEKYDIKILKGQISYDRMLQKNEELFINDKSLKTINFRLYQYTETKNNLSFKEIITRNKAHLTKMNSLQNTEFKEVEKLYKIKEHTIMMKG